MGVRFFFTPRGDLANSGLVAHAFDDSLTRLRFGVDISISFVSAPFSSSMRLNPLVGGVLRSGLSSKLHSLFGAIPVVRVDAGAGTLCLLGVGEKKDTSEA